MDQPAPKATDSTVRRARNITIPLLICIAFVLFLTGITFPFFHVTKFWVFHDAVSVVTGLISLADAKEYFLFAILFTFTLLFPVIKMVLLAATWWIEFSDAKRARTWVRRVGTLSKWSMLDVFVVAILVVVMKARSLAEIQIGIGLYLFTFSVLSTQAATFWMEKRLDRS